MNRSKLNKLFNARQSMTAGLFESMVQKRLVMKTDATLTPEQVMTHIFNNSLEKREEAKKAYMIAGSSEQEAEERVTNRREYTGLIFLKNANDRVEAEKLVKQRGFGERLRGLVNGSGRIGDRGMNLYERVN